jgi:hypothetical protein
VAYHRPMRSIMQQGMKRVQFLRHASGTQYHRFERE